MKFKKIINGLKWVWFVAVLIASGWYIVARFPQLRSSLSTISGGRLIISFLFLCAGKVLTTDLTYHSLMAAPQIVPFKDAFAITTITQLGKYLPGGVWHFAGKFGVYKARGFTAKAAIQPIILENLWLMASSLFVGLSALLLSDNQLPCTHVPFLCDQQIASWTVILLFFAWIVSIYLIERFFFKINMSVTARLRLVLEKVALWTIFGTSFWLIFPVQSNWMVSLQAISAFSISWLIGYLAFFAPGGIGVREAVMVFILSSFISLESLALYTAIHRLLWVGAEIGLALIAMLLFGLPLGMDASEKKERQGDR